MGMAIAGAISVVCIVFFCMECAGKINREAAGTGIIYLLFPVISGVLLCVSVLTMQSVPGISSALTNAVDTAEDYLNGDADMSGVISFLIQCAAAFPAFILPLIGGIRIALSNRNKPISGGFGANDGGELCILPVVSSVFGTLSAAALAVFVCIVTATAVGSVTMGLTELLLATIVFGMLTFGIGFVIMAVGIPIYVLVLGAYTAVMCLPMAAGAAVSGAVFCIMQVLTVIFTAVQMRRMYKESLLSKKKAIILSLLSAIPLINVILSVRTRMKTKRMGFI